MQPREGNAPLWWYQRACSRECDSEAIFKLEERIEQPYRRGFYFPLIWFEKWNFMSCFQVINRQGTPRIWPVKLIDGKAICAIDASKCDWFRYATLAYLSFIALIMLVKYVWPGAIGLTYLASWRHLMAPIYMKAHHWLCAWEFYR